MGYTKQSQRHGLPTQRNVQPQGHKLHTLHAAIKL